MMSRRSSFPFDALADSDRKKILQSMTILVDVHDQPSARALKRYERFGCPYSRAKLLYGGYAYNTTLPDGQMLFDTTKIITPPLAILRMDGLDELAYAFGVGRASFTDMLERASHEDKCDIFIIVENADWEDIINHNYHSNINSNALFGSITAYMIRYKVHFLFCNENLTARLIEDICKKDLKERLERGSMNG